MNFLKTLFALILCFLLFAGVKCNKDEPVPFIPLDNEFLSYFAFPVGSWWVYEEVNSELKDSIWVIKNESEKWEDDEEKLNYYRLSYHLKNSSDEYYFLARPIYIYECYIFVLSESNLFRFFFPYELKDTLGSLYVKDVIDSLTINNILYNNIIAMANKDTNAYLINEYYCKNIGIIKKEYFDGKIFELKNYFINN